MSNNPFANIFDMYHNSQDRAIAELVNLAKEHHDNPELETMIRQTLKTFVSNLNTAQSALYFDMVNHLPVRKVISVPSGFHSHDQTQLPIIVNKLPNPLTDDIEKEEPIGYAPNSHPFDLDESLDLETVDLSSPKQNPKIGTPPGYYDSILQDYSQCCARMGSIEYYIEHEDPEFLDNYPPGTFQSLDGYVIGDPCMRMVNNKLFERGQIFCIRHSTGFEDIRKPPSSRATDHIADSA